MARWEPDARGRLRQAALELFADDGFERTTVSDIAERAGLTKRTFFRHFADKREVLFDGSSDLQQLFVETVDGAAAGTAPLDALRLALHATGEQFFEPRRPFSTMRQHVITANPELQERELNKFATLSAALAGALRRREVPDPQAVLAAETGVGIFKIAFERWVSDPGAGAFVDIVDECFAQLRAMTDETSTRPHSASMM